MKKPVILKSSRKPFRKSLEKQKLVEEKKRAENQLVVSEAEIADIVSSWTKIPVKKAGRRRNTKTAESGEYPS